MLDDPQTVGVQFNNAGGPDPPNLVEISVRIRKTGDGAGRVTATGLDCGGTCIAKYEYGKLERFSVVADQARSSVDGVGYAPRIRSRNARFPSDP